MRLFGGPKWQAALTESAKRAQGRASVLQSDFTRVWAEVAAVSAGSAAKALLNAPSRRLVAAQLNEAGADRLLAVVTAEFLELFTSLPGNLAVMNSWEVSDASVFVEDVLRCFDPYGIAVFEVARNIRMAGDERWATKRTFALDCHVAIAVLAPSEVRAFSDPLEAAAAGHKFASQLVDSLITSDVAIEVYEKELTPQLEHRLKAMLEARRQLREMLWQDIQRKSPRDAAIETWATFEAMARDAGMWFSQLAERELADGNVFLGATRSTETSDETNTRQWRTMFEFWAFNYIACDIHIASLAGTRDRGPIMDAIGDECTQSFAELMSGDQRPLALPDPYYKAFTASQVEYGSVYAAAGWPEALNKLGAKVAQVSDLEPADQVAAAAAQIMRQVMLSDPAKR